MTLLPFAGIAFPWFIGVIRDRLGKMEDLLMLLTVNATPWLMLILPAWVFVVSVCITRQLECSKRRQP